jgi:hypothetical protein
MKTVYSGKQAAMLLLERGKGSEPGLDGGGLVLRCMVAEDDGTVSECGAWYQDEAQARAVYDAPPQELIDWLIGEARRQTLPYDQRPEQAARPATETTVGK